MNRRTPRSQSLRRPRASSTAASAQNLVEKVVLDRVLGITAPSNSALALDPNSGLVAYPAGFVVVGYNTKRSKQQLFLNSRGKKTITTLDFSRDGKFIVTGESGHLPMVRVWNVEERTQLAEYSGHNFRINCVAFNPSGRFIVSVGSPEDMTINVWDRSANHKLASSKVSSKVNSVVFSDNSQFFVTVGNRHVRYWYMDLSRSKMKETLPLQGRNAILGDFMNNNFTDVGICMGRDSGAGQTFTFVTSQAGQLFQFNEQRYLDKWVELKTARASSISVSETCILVGCSSGIIRIFDTSNLHYLTTLPLPHNLGVDLTNPEDDVDKLNYADVVALKYDHIHSRVTVVYSDRSLYVWDLRDLRSISKISSNLYHSAGVWSVVSCPTDPLPADTFVTCSDDDTIRIWNLTGGAGLEDPRHSNNVSKELVKVIYTDPHLTYLCEADRNSAEVDILGLLGSWQDKPAPVQELKRGVRTIAASPDGLQLAAGDREGNLRVYTLDTFEELYSIEAHEGEILSMHYFQSPSVPELMLLCSTSRDRLIHVFDPTQGFSLVQTLDDHSAAIFGARLVETPDCDVRLVSCGADKSLMFRVLEPDEQGESARFYLEHQLMGKNTQNDLCLSPGRKFVAVACQDRQLRIYNLVTGKLRKTYKGSLAEDGPLLRCSIDPTGTYVATTGFDKMIYLLDFHTGELEASFSGHSELVLGLVFLPDLRRLVTVGGDGCVLVWRLPVNMTAAMRQRQMQQVEMVDSSISVGGAPSAVNPEEFLQKPSDAQILFPKAATPPLENMTVPSVSKPPSNSGFKFSVAVLPSWAQRKFNRRDSVAHVQLNESGLPVTACEASVDACSAGHLTWAEHGRDGGGCCVTVRPAEGDSGSNCSSIELAGRRLSLSSGLPPRVVQDEDETEEDGLEDEFAVAKTGDNRLNPVGSCDLESLHTTSTGDDEDEDPLATENTSPPPLPLIEQMRQLSSTGSPSSTLLASNVNRVTSSSGPSYPVVHTASTRGPRASVPNSLSLLDRTLSPTSSVSMPTTPFDEDEDPHTEDSLEGGDCAKSETAETPDCFHVNECDDEDTMAALADLEDVLDKHETAISDQGNRQSLSSRFYSKTQPSLVHNLAGNDKPRKHAATMSLSRSTARTKLRGGIPEFGSSKSLSSNPPSITSEEATKKRDTMSQVAEATRRRLRQTSSVGDILPNQMTQRNNQPVPKKSTVCPGPPSVRTRSVGSRKSSTDLSSTLHERKRSGNLDDTNNLRKATKPVKRDQVSNTATSVPNSTLNTNKAKWGLLSKAESARGTRTPLMSAGGHLPSSPRPSTTTSSLRSVSTERTHSLVGINKTGITTPRPGTTRGPTPRGAGDTAGMLKKATSMTSVTSSSGPSSCSGSRNTVAPGTDCLNPLPEMSKRLAGGVVGAAPLSSRAKWDREGLALRKKREQRKSCPVQSGDVSAARQLVQAANKNRAGSLAPQPANQVEEDNNVLSFLKPASSLPPSEELNTCDNASPNNNRENSSASASANEIETNAEASTNKSRGSPELATTTSLALVREAAAYIQQQEPGKTESSFNQAKWGLDFQWISADKGISRPQEREHDGHREHVIDDEEDAMASQDQSAWLPTTTTTTTSGVETGSSAGGSSTTLASTGIGEDEDVEESRPAVDVQRIISGLLTGRQTRADSVTSLGGFTAKGSSQIHQDSSSKIKSKPTSTEPSKRFRPNSSGEMEMEKPLLSYETEIDHCDFEDEEEREQDEEEEEDATTLGDKECSGGTTVKEAMAALKDAVDVALMCSENATNDELLNVKDTLSEVDLELAKLRARCDLPQLYVDSGVAEILMREFGERLVNQVERCLSSS